MTSTAPHRAISFSLNAVRSILKRVLENAFTFGCALFLVLMTIAVFEQLLKWHWSAGFILIAFYGFAILQGIADFKHRRLTPQQGLGATVLLTCTSAAVFATISYMLATTGLATYQGGVLTYERFLWFYAWMFVDLLPAIDATKTLGLAAPFTPVGVSGGLPVVAFKGFIVLVLLKVIKDWWSTPTPGPASTAASASAPTSAEPHR